MNCKHGVASEERCLECEDEALDEFIDDEEFEDDFDEEDDFVEDDDFDEDHYYHNDDFSGVDLEDYEDDD